MKQSFIEDIKGVTLIELILVVALISVVIAIGYSLFFFGINTFGISERQSNLQSDMRFAMDTVIREIRFVNSLEIIPSDQARDPNQQESGYNYFYIEGNNLFHVIYDESTGQHKTVAYGGHIKSDSSFFKRINSNTLSIRFVSEYGNHDQTNNAQTEIKLQNLRLSGNEIMGLEESLGLKFSTNTLR